MKKIKLTKGKFAIVDDGLYDELNSYSWYATKRSNTHYACRRASRKDGHKLVYMHRYILGLTSKDKSLKTDHKNGNGLDNRSCNLRVCSQAENACNKSSAVGSTSRFLGVVWRKDKNKWCAQIRKDGKNNYLGLFEDEIAAAKAYDDAAKKLHGEFANLNLVD